MFRAKRPDGSYTEVLELFAIHCTLGGRLIDNEDEVIEDWIEKSYDIEKWVDGKWGAWW